MTDHDTRSMGKRSRDGRVPPHNLAAEEAALGAAMLSRQAAETVAELTSPGDFYKPAHQFIAGAIAELLAEDDPQIDTVTVVDRLRRSGMLDEIGGPEYVVGLMNATPAISGAAKYARIVRDAATLRRLIWTASSIAELGYTSHDDPSSAIVRAGELLAQMDPGDARTLSTLDVADIAALLATDLEPESGTFLTRTDGTSLLYAGKMHVLQAEPSSGKSWLALGAVKEVLDLGGSAIYLDFEDTPSGILRRLRNLGCDGSAMADRLVYARPLGKYGPAERLQVDRLLDRLNPDLVVIDGVGESLSRNGLSEDKADDVLRWFDLFPRPIAATGAAVLMIDHVAKDPEQRGRWARGSGAKLGAIDGASYQVKVVHSFSRKRAGTVKLVVAKDRPGGVGAIGETAAIVRIEPHGGGERVIVTLEPDTAELAITDQHKPTGVMAMIVREIENARVPLTPKALEALVHARPQTYREALARLEAEGFVAVGKGRVGTVRILRPYHGGSSRPEPPDLPEAEPEPPPQLWEEPPWIAEEAEQHRAYLDSLARDPGPSPSDLFDH